MSDDDSESSNVLDTPGGTRWWIPDVIDDLIKKPVDDDLYDTLDEAFKMYQTYADKCGFSVRKGTHKMSKEKRITHKYYLCNKAGKARTTKSVNTLTDGTPIKDQRNTNFKVTDCPARIKLKAIPGTSLYRLYDFVEKHNHPMDEPENKDLSRVNRKLNFEDRKYIFDASLSNCGASMAHRLRACLKGGYENVRGTVVDYKNWRRDINKFIGNRDAQMLVDKLKIRKKYLSDFSFDYVCENRELTCLFWADETAKCNYKVFGDVVSFDATFRTNK